MAIHVEDHPVSYSTFEGTIPEAVRRGERSSSGTRHLGAGGRPARRPGQGQAALPAAREKLAGLWELVRISKPGAEKQDQWMLFKKRGDAWARPIAEYDVITALPDSVVEKPLGLVEEREPRARGRAHGATPAKRIDAALALAEDAPLPATLVASACDPRRLGAGRACHGSWRTSSTATGCSRGSTATRCGCSRETGTTGHRSSKSLAAAVAELDIGCGWLDGEIVVMNGNGMPDFNALQNSIDNARTNDVVYFVFDLPYHGGKDLRQVPLVARRARLQA